MNKEVLVHLQKAASLCNNIADDLLRLSKEKTATNELARSGLVGQEELNYLYNRFSDADPELRTEMALQLADARAANKTASLQNLSNPLVGMGSAVIEDTNYTYPLQGQDRWAEADANFLNTTI